MSAGRCSICPPARCCACICASFSTCPTSTAHALRDIAGAAGSSGTLPTALTRRGSRPTTRRTVSRRSRRMARGSCSSALRTGNLDVFSIEVRWQRCGPAHAYPEFRVSSELLARRLEDRLRELPRRRLPVTVTWPDGSDAQVITNSDHSSESPDWAAVVSPGAPTGTPTLCPAGTSASLRCLRDGLGRHAMIGTELDEPSVRTSGRDRISPFGGDHTVNARGQRSRLGRRRARHGQRGQGPRPASMATPPTTGSRGGSGRDSLAGGSGNDRLSGGSGRDRLVCGSGRDHASARAAIASRARASADAIASHAAPRARLSLDP